MAHTHDVRGGGSYNLLPFFAYNRIGDSMLDQKECQDLGNEEAFLKALVGLYEKNQRVLLGLKDFPLLFEEGDEDSSRHSLEKIKALMAKNLESITKLLQEPIKAKALGTWREFIFNIFDDIFTYYQDTFVFFDKALGVGIQDELTKKPL